MISDKEITEYFENRYQGEQSKEENEAFSKMDEFFNEWAYYLTQRIFIAGFRAGYKQGQQLRPDLQP